MPHICPPATADTNRTSIFYAIEDDDCWGATPEPPPLAPKGFELRMTGETVIHNKATIVSETIRTDRMRDTISEVGATAEGDINFELAFRDLESLLEGAFANDFVYLLERTFGAGDLEAINATNRISVVAGAVDFAGFIAGADVHISGFIDNTINNGRMLITTVDGADVFIVVDTEVFPVTPLTDETPVGTTLVRTPKGNFTDLEIQTSSTVGSATTDFLVDVNLEVGQSIRMEGWDVAASNGVFKITAISANLLTLDTTALTIETAGVVTLTAQRLKNGFARKSFVIEKFFGDVTQFMSFTGMRVGNMTLNVESQALVTGVFSFMGKEGVSSQVTVLGSQIPAGIQDALNATTNVGNIEEGGIDLVTAIRSIDIAIGNNLRQKPQVGSKSSVDIGYGFVDVTGTMSVYFEDATLLAKFIDHTESSLTFTFTDSDGNSMVFTLPRLFFTSGSPTAPGGNDDVILGMEYTAVRSQADDAVVIVDALPAAL